MPGYAAQSDEEEVSGEILVVDTHVDHQRLKTLLSEAGHQVCVIESISELVLLGSLKAYRMLVVIIYPENASEMQALIRNLREHAALARTQLIECQAVNPDWEVELCRQLSVGQQHGAQA